MPPKAQSVIWIQVTTIFMPPFEKEGAYCFAYVRRPVGLSVGRYVGLP